MARQSSGSTVEHFGVRLRGSSKYGLRIDRTTYATTSRTCSEAGYYLWAASRGWFSESQLSEWFVDPTTCREYKEEYAKRSAQFALRNFDLNMLYFEGLDREQFEVELAGFLRDFSGLEEIMDLTEWTDLPGVYIMVLDEFKQVYVGQSERIGARIRQHWISTKRLDRLIYGSDETSLLSVDSFRALDTTRIFAQTTGLTSTRKRESFERQLVARINPDLSLNRISGGTFDRALDDEGTSGRKTRDLAVSEDELIAYRQRLKSSGIDLGRSVKPIGRKVPTPAQSFDDPIRALEEVLNERAQGWTALVDAGGIIVAVYDGGAPRKAHKHIQLFEVPCGLSIPSVKLEQALALAASLPREAPTAPVRLFDELGEINSALKN